MSEQNIMRSIMVAVSRAGARVFRNNVAMAWVGEWKRYVSPTKVTVGPGDVVIRNARPLHAGLCEGSSDLIGITPVVVRPDHVGQKLGVFTALEVKTPEGHVTPEQANFVEQISLAGGIAGIARSDDEALALLGKFES